MVAPAFAPSTRSGDAGTPPVNGDPIPPYSPPAGNTIVKRLKSGPLGGPPSCFWVKQIALEGNALELTPNRGDALGMDATTASRVLEWYASKDIDRVGEFTSEIR